MPRIAVPVRMRWSDIDGYGHVNNAAMFTLLEEARIATFWSIGAAEPVPGRADDGAALPGSVGAAENGGPGQTQAVSDGAPSTKVLTGGAGAASHTLVARQEIEYLAPLEYSQDAVRVDLWVGRIGGASLEVCYEVYSPAGVLCAKAATSIVMVDAATASPRRLTDEERAALGELLEDPITFRRR